MNMDKSCRAQVAPDDCGADLPTYDDTVLIGMVDGDLQLAAQILQEFGTALRAGVDQMAGAFVSGRTKDVMAAAHRLKSSSRTVGAMRLGELCDRLEAGAKGGSRDTVRGLIDAVTAESEAVVQRLSRPVNPR
jgi:HPt (histidine-containing phosphotransfer) domain-containing protein